MTDLVAIRSDKNPHPKQIAVISGKGGTGKTSLVASFAALSRNSVLADCDVDAADLHLLLDPRIVRREPFTGGKRARIKADQCVVCGKCKELCRFDAISFDGPGNKLTKNTFRMDPVVCEGCGVCA
jgi:MinD superfamily P-loop ATPase